MKSKGPRLAALMLSLLALGSACAPIAPPPSQFGLPAAVANASRTISLSPRVRYVHVHSGETVAFRIGDKMLGWTFMVEPVGGGRSVDLSAIFPDLPQAKGVVVFIERSNLYRAG